MSARLIAVLGVLFFSFQTSATELETITVSATPIKVDDAGSSVTVITREEMLRRNASIQSLLRSVPGFSVNQQGSSGAITQVRVRGAEANQVLVMINGIEANDLSQSSEFDFSQISLGDVERIEIVRGPQSALWGSDALAGVVHIITRPETDTSSLTASAEAGSFSTARTTLTGNFSTNRNRVKFSADNLKTDGTNISRHGSEDDGLESLTLSLSGTFKASDRLDVTYSLRHTDKTSEFDDIDFFADGLPTDAENVTESQYLYGGVTVSRLINDRLDQFLSVSRTSSDNKTRPTGEITEGIHDALRYQFNLVGDYHRLSIRAEHETEDFRQRGAASFFGDPNQNRDARTNSFAAEYRYDNDWLHLSLSARQDENSEYDDANSWRATGNFKAGDSTFYASVGESVKNPTFTERFGFFTSFVGNPDLEPEHSLHWEIGAKRSFLDNSLDLSLTWFQADLDNEINGFVFDFMTGSFTSANIDGDSHRQGAELEIDYDLSERFDVRMAYTYLEATQEDFTGKDVTEVRRPRHTGSISMNYTFDNAGLNLTISRTGTQEDDYFPPFPPFQERVRLGGFTLVELAGYYRINSRVSLTARIENAGDETYEQVFGFASPGAAAYLGVRVNW